MNSGYTRQGVALSILGAGVKEWSMLGLVKIGCGKESIVGMGGESWIHSLVMIARSALCINIEVYADL